MKTFCDIPLCCLDATAIITRNGFEFHDYSLIVKYTRFSILIIIIITSDLQSSTAIAANQLLHK